VTAWLHIQVDTGAERVPCGTVVTLGRDRNNTIVFSEPEISRNHAMVRRLGAADYYFIDSGSSNGSWVNGRRVTAPTLLHDGDIISIGRSEIIFEQPAPSAAFTDSLSLQATVVMPRALVGEITLLVADIRGFTALSERLSIQQLTRVMNRWFDEVSEIIAHHAGIVDKFIGDCVFARWEGGESQHDVREALRAACRIGAITAALNDAFPEIPMPLHIGVGIHTGIAALGIGHENTALGDTVNTAFRLEAASMALETDIVLSESAYAHLPDEFRQESPQELHLKGKANPVHVVTLDFAHATALLARLPD